MAKFYTFSNGDMINVDNVVKVIFSEDSVSFFCINDDFYIYSGNYTSREAFELEKCNLRIYFNGLSCNVTVLPTA